MARLIKGFRRSMSIPKLTLHRRCNDPPLQDDRSSEVPERFGSPDQIASPVIDVAYPEDPIYSPAIRTAYALTFLEASQESQEYTHLTSARIQLLQQLVHRDGAAIVSLTELEKQLKGTLDSLDLIHEEIEVAGVVAADTRCWQAYHRLVEVEKQILTLSEDKKDVSSSTEESTTGTSESTRLLTNPEQLPQPRHEVLRRLKLSESSRSLYLTRPDIPRRGSANGFHIASLIMSNVSDHRFVLPYLHHIKHHEVRVLKQWLVDRDLVRQSGSISRIEKLLHCVQLLQTGMRYESIAVVYSRTPRQVMESCHEVMKGLARLYEETSDQKCEKEVYEKLWGIARRFAIGQLAKVEKYYGLKWDDVKKVLVALNVYVGIWRGSANPLDARASNWESYIEVKECGRPSIVAEESGEESEDDSVEVVGLDMEEYNKPVNSDCSTLTSIDTSSSSLYEEPVVQAAIAQPVWYRKL